MHALGKCLGHEFPTGRAALRRFELARIAQMQSRTSFFRFVREHLMRHAEPGRDDLPVESGLLPHATARGIHRALRAAAHVFRGQLLRGQHGETLHHAGRVLVHEVPAQIGGPVMQPGDTAPNAFEAQRSLLLAGALPLQRRQFGQFGAQPARLAMVWPSSNVAQSLIPKSIPRR